MRLSRSIFALLVVSHSAVAHIPRGTALNRPYRTTETPLTNGITITAKAATVEHYYDPQFEFLETGVSENGSVTWKVLGLDMDGVYGGQNGTGGFEAIVPGPELFCPLVPDSFGNIHGVYDQNHQALMWYSSRITANGAVPGYAPVPLGQQGADLGAKYAFANRAYQGIGTIWMGDNMYDPISAQFLRHDSYGHNSSPNGRTPFRGNRWAYWDADGRLSAAWNSPLTVPDVVGFHLRLEAIIAQATGGYFEPPVVSQRSWGARAGSFFADAIFNATPIQEGLHELAHPDFSTFLGGATFAVGVIDVGANTLDAAGNLIPGKAAVEDLIKTGIKGIGKLVAKDTPKLLNPGINLTEQGMQHVVERHIVNGIPEFAGKSKFTTGINLEQLIQEGTQMPMARQANGNFARTFDAGRAIGIDRATGQASSTVTIITAPNGNLVTMFPGAP